VFIPLFSNKRYSLLDSGDKISDRANSYPLAGDS
jgi:hypothetical protein